MSASSLLPGCTGKGVKVAVVDSGINAHHSHVRGVAGGVHIRWCEDGSLAFDEDYRDTAGHGTAIAGVIRAKTPDVELYSIKVFGRTLWTRAEVVAAAIRWAVENRMHVVNISLGTDKTEKCALLEQACDDAAERGVVLVAAGDNREPDLFPASLSSVFGVAGDEQCGWDDYFFCPAELVEFRAHPYPRPLPCLPQRFNLRGHSFAAAHITALIARILERSPAADKNEIMRILVAHSTPETGLARASAGT